MTASMASYIRFWASARPDRPIVEFGDRVMTWRELDTRSDELAVGFTKLGVSKGDVISVLLENSVEFVEVIAAAVKLGMLVAPLNPRLAAPEVEYQIGDAGSRV